VLVDCNKPTLSIIATASFDAEVACVLASAIKACWAAEQLLKVFSVV
jgi:hypothetical protein